MEPVLYYNTLVNILCKQLTVSWSFPNYKDHDSLVLGNISCSMFNKLILPRRCPVMPDKLTNSKLTCEL